MLNISDMATENQLSSNHYDTNALQQGDEAQYTWQRAQDERLECTCYEPKPLPVDRHHLSLSDDNRSSRQWDSKVGMERKTQLSTENKNGNAIYFTDVSAPYYDTTQYLTTFTNPSMHLANEWKTATPRAMNFVLAGFYPRDAIKLPPLYFH